MPDFPHQHITIRPQAKRMPLEGNGRGKSGSLVQDVWQGSPAELSEMSQIAIFPVKGWFASRKFAADHEFHNCHQQRVSYSLILSIDAEQEIGLYNAVSNLVNIEVDV